MKRLSIIVAIVLGLSSPAFIAGPVIAQDKPKVGDEVKEFRTYNDIFDEFGKRREVELTKMEALQQLKDPPVDELRAIEAALKKIDEEYCVVLTKYIAGHPDADDLEYARYELVIYLSKFEDHLAEAVKAADEFLAAHKGSKIAPAVEWARAQSLFRLTGREGEALTALDKFIADHPNVSEADFARTMRVRLLLFQDKVEDARKALKDLLNLDKVKSDADAKAFIQRQLDNLDWIGRDLPKFALPDTEGNARATSDYTGKPLLVFVWDSTSGVCLDEIGFVKAAYEQCKKDGLGVIGFSVNESKPALEQWMKRNTPGFPSVWEERDKENNFVKRLDVQAIPFSVLVDGKGKIFRYDVRSDDLLRFSKLLIDKEND